MVEQPSQAAASGAHLGDIDIRPIDAQDLAAISALHADAFGPGRFARSAYRVREGGVDVSAHCRAGWRGGELIGAVTMTAVAIDETDTVHWLLGPLAVRADSNSKGLGRKLVQEALTSVGDASATATVVLVGDLEYYGRLGFEAVPRGEIVLPGPVDPQRLLIWRGGDGARAIPAGLVRPIGRDLG
ncbi:MAG: GNAT family N-acetyltransferase [Hyphomicrobiaceae bacterium]